MRFHSHFPDIEIPSVDIPTFMLEYSKNDTIFGKSPDSIALTDESTSLSFSDIERLSHKFASGLANNLQFKRGSIVAIILPNCVQYPIVTLAFQMVGGTCATINPEYNPRELAYHLDLVGVQYIITTEEKITSVKEALKLCGIPIQPENILTIDGKHNCIEKLYSDKPFNRVRLNTEGKVKDTVAFIVFSSGTTGMPKGVMISHRNIIANILQSSAHMKNDDILSVKANSTQHKTMICALPLFHMLALSCMLHFGLYNGFHIVITRRFDLERFCALSEQYKACFSCVVPPIVLGFAKNPVVTKYNLSSYAVICSGAAPLSKELQLEAQKRTGIRFIQECGLSEASGIVSRGLTRYVVHGSCGVLPPSIEAKVIDDDGRERAVDEVGELCFKGPNIMLGYINNPQATIETIDDDGFLHTGDIGYIDKDGNCFIADRKKELIKYKGFQVAPAELEGILTSHPAVIDSAVIPVYDEEHVSEIPKAFVVVHPEHKTANLIEDIRKWVDSRVIGYKRLRGGIEIIDEIPKSVSGKILRQVLKGRGKK